MLHHFREISKKGFNVFSIKAKALKMNEILIIDQKVLQVVWIDE